MSAFNQFFTSVRRSLNLLREGHINIFFKELHKRTYNDCTTLGLRRDLDIPFTAPEAKTDISIRLLKKGDLGFLLEHGAVAKQHPKLASEREALVEADIPKCYVAVTPKNTPCFIQWVFRASQNDRIQNYFNGIFPTLDKDEALLEGAYMHRTFRGLGIMPAAIDKILQIEKEAGVQQVTTFVDINNIPSLKGIRRSGFFPYVMRKVRWLSFQRSISYHPIPQNILEKYELSTTDRSDQFPISRKASDI